MLADGIFAMLVLTLARCNVIQIQHPDWLRIATKVFGSPKDL